MGIYYNPPQPPTGSTAATPEIPHVPLGTQGSQPPRQHRAVAAMLIAVMASWPSDLEPRLQRPNDTRVKIAPLTLSYGQQPPRFSIASRMEVAYNAWPQDLEPRLGKPNEQQVKIAPLTFTYGSRVIPVGPITPAEYAKFYNLSLYDWSIVPLQLQQKNSAAIIPIPVVATTIPVGPITPTEYSKFYTLSSSYDWSVIPYLGLQQKNSAAIIPTPVVATFVPSAQYPKHIWSAWSDLSTRSSAPIGIAPLTQIYGDQPPITGTTAVTESLIVSSWPADLESYLKPPNNTRVKIAPLTFTYGDQPPGRLLKFSSIPIDDSIITQAQIKSAAITPSFISYTQLPTHIWAAWTDSIIRSQPRVVIAPLISVPVVVTYTPYTSTPALIWTAWTDPIVKYPIPVTIAPLTQVYGSQPQPQSALAVSKLISIVSTWAQSWDAQTAPKCAAWYVPPVISATIPYTPLPQLIWSAWEPRWIQPPTLISIAPLTQTYGNQPPVKSSVDRQLIAVTAWTPDSLPVPRLVTTAWPILVQQVPYRGLPLSIRSAWDESFILPQRLITLVPFQIQQIPYKTLPLAIRASWDEPFSLPKRLISIAPLALVYGSQPIPTAFLNPTEYIQIVGSWPLDLEPRLHSRNVTPIHIAPLTFTYGSQPPRRPPLLRIYNDIIARTWIPFLPGPPPLVEIATTALSRARVSFIYGQGSLVPLITGGQGSLTPLISGGQGSYTPLIQSGGGSNSLYDIYHDLVIAHGAVAYWPFDELSGTIAYDKSGNNNHGTYDVDVALGSPGPLATGATAMDVPQTFAGKALLPSTAIVGLTGESSLEVWVRADSIPTFNMAFSSPNGSVYLALSPNNFNAGYANAGVSSDFDTPPVVINNWYHVVIAWGGGINTIVNGQLFFGSQLKIYVNGVLCGETGFLLASDGFVTNWGIGDLATGVFLVDPSGSTAFDGAISNLAIYPTELTDVQVLQHYQVRLEVLQRISKILGSGSLVTTIRGSGSSNTTEI